MKLNLRYVGMVLAILFFVAGGVYASEASAAAEEAQPESIVAAAKYIAAGLAVGIACIAGAIAVGLLVMGSLLKIIRMAGKKIKAAS